MMVMTAKVDIKKVLIILAIAVAAIIGLIMLFGNGESPAVTDTTATATTGVVTNDNRVKFLSDFGWEVNPSPTESSQVRIPKDSSEVFDRYNRLQKSQGYDLSPFAGKTVMRYVYKIENFPNATAPVYATLLIYKNQIIGGDITDTAARGQIQGFQKTAASKAPSTAAQETPPTTAPETPSTAPSA